MAEGDNKELILLVALNNSLVTSIFNWSLVVDYHVHHYPGSCRQGCGALWALKLDYRPDLVIIECAEMWAKQVCLASTQLGLPTWLVTANQGEDIPYPKMQGVERVIMLGELTMQEISRRLY